MSRISRRMLATRSSTGARVDSAWKRASSGPPSRIVSERHGRPSISTVRVALAVGRGGRGRRDVAAGGPRPRRRRRPGRRCREPRSSGSRRAARGRTGRPPGRPAEHLARPARAAPCRPPCGRRARPRRAAARPRARPPSATASSAAERDPRAQAARRPHGRSTQPTPRTVCSVRGSPPASSLRRTYPTKTSTTLVSTSDA